MANYLPILKWKRGEMDALRLLFAHDRTQIIPLLELLDDTIDPDEPPPVQGAPTAFDRAAAKVLQCWGTANFFVDADELDVSAPSVPHPVDRLFAACRQINLSAIPVTSLNTSAAFLQEVRAIIAADGRGCGVRVDPDDLVDPGFSASLLGVLGALGVTAGNVDLILDWREIQPTAGAATSLAVGAIVPALPHLAHWRSVVFAASSFPPNLGSAGVGVSTILRAEWAAYKLLLAQRPGNRSLSFGDYAIAYPTYTPAPYLGAASIRYAIDGEWLIFRGRTLRGPVYGGFSQFQQLCAQVIAHPSYCGNAFSWGDGYIERCGNGQEGTGNLTTWRTVGTNHHLTFVAQQLANYHVPLTGTAPPPVGP